MVASRERGSSDRRKMGSPDASVLSRLKEELIYAELFDSIAVAKSATFEYIEVFYNRKRRHSALCYLGPVEYERRCALPSVYFSWVGPVEKICCYGVRKYVNE